MKAGQKFLLGAGIIVGSVALLMAPGSKRFGQYSLKPAELAEKISRDPTLHETGLKEWRPRSCPGRSSVMPRRRPSNSW